MSQTAGRTAQSDLALGRYRLEQRLGVGASATVWRAFDLRRQQPVALKLLHPHLVLDPEARGRLRAEAELARRLKHLGIARLLDAHLGPDEPALAFELVRGETLADRLRRGGALDAATATSIGAAVGAALAHAHARGVVHRDVKPSNILLGDDGRVQLLDFGVSSLAGVSAMTQLGSAVGTLPYMAPEQLAGEPANPASDVFALGVVLHEMLAGEPPFSATTPLALARAQLEPVAVPDAAPRPVGDAIRAALQLNPAERPSAAVIAGALERALATSDATQRVAAVGGTTLFPAARVAPRRRIAAGAMAALALVLVAAVAIAGIGPPPAEPVGDDRVLALALAPSPAVTLPPSAAPTPTERPATAVTPAPRPRAEPANNGAAAQPRRAEDDGDDDDARKGKDDDKKGKGKKEKKGKGKKGGR